MRQFEIKDKNFNSNNYYDLANMFNIYQNKDGFNIFSINRTLIINTQKTPIPNIYSIYTVKYGDSWTSISYNHYGTIELWWLICKFNSILDPTKGPIEGEKLMIPTKEIANNICEFIRKA